MEATERLQSGPLTVERVHPERASADHFAPGFRMPEGLDSTWLFLDLETTGLASADMVFLAGTLQPQGPALLLRQDFASDLVGERRLLATVAEQITPQTLLVTYNGRCFDVPFLRRRLAFHGLPALPPSLRQIDLLTEVRRRHSRSWPNCRLATAERRLLGKRRTAIDVPGSEVPRLFEQALASGRPALLDPVIYHNRIDLTSMVALLTRFPAAEAVGMTS